MEKQRTRFWFKATGNEAFWNQDVSVLPIPEAIEFLCKRNGIFTLEKLADNWDNLPNLKGFGVSKVKMVRASFFAYLCEVNKADNPTHIVDIW